MPWQFYLIFNTLSIFLSTLSHYPAPWYIFHNITTFPSRPSHAWWQTFNHLTTFPSIILPSSPLLSYHLSISTKQHHAVTVHDSWLAGAGNGHLQTARRKTFPHLRSKERYSLGTNKLPSSYQCQNNIITSS